jgi:hypothetical protein
VSKEKNVLTKFVYRGLPTSLLIALCAFAQFYAIRAFF